MEHAKGIFYPVHDPNFLSHYIFFLIFYFEQEKSKSEGLRGSGIYFIARHKRRRRRAEDWGRSPQNYFVMKNSEQSLSPDILEKGYAFHFVEIQSVFCPYI